MDKASPNFIRAIELRSVQLQSVQTLLRPPVAKSCNHTRTIYTNGVFGSNQWQNDPDVIITIESREAAELGDSTQVIAIDGRVIAGHPGRQKHGAGPPGLAVLADESEVALLAVHVDHAGAQEFAPELLDLRTHLTLEIDAAHARQAWHVVEFLESKEERAHTPIDDEYGPVVPSEMECCRESCRPPPTMTVSYMAPGV